MSKLTEIKETLSKITQGIWWHYQTNNSVVVDPKEPIFIRKTVADCGDFENAKFIADAPEYITYLLSLLEEKDKALEFYADKESYKGVFQPTGFQVYIKPVEADAGDIARKALNTSSNNEGEK